VPKNGSPQKLLDFLLTRVFHFQGAEVFEQLNVGKINGPHQ
jgi:hypothetical protein